MWHSMHKFFHSAVKELQNLFIVKSCIVQGDRFIVSPSFRTWVLANVCMVTNLMLCYYCSIIEAVGTGFIFY
jgi:hypothetical protein